jgi:hypothetical protein
VAFSWEIRLRRRGELEPELVETRQEERKPLLNEVLDVKVRKGPAIQARIVHFAYVPPTVVGGQGTYRITANEIKRA